MGQSKRFINTYVIGYCRIRRLLLFVIASHSTSGDNSSSFFSFLFCWVLLTSRRPPPPLFAFRCTIARFFDIFLCSSLLFSKFSNLNFWPLTNWLVLIFAFFSFFSLLISSLLFLLQLNKSKNELKTHFAFHPFHTRTHDFLFFSFVQGISSRTKPTKRVIKKEKKLN